MSCRINMPQRDVNVQIVKIVSYIFYSVFYKRGILKRDIIISQSYLKYLTYLISYWIFQKYREWIFDKVQRTCLLFWFDKFIFYFSTWIDLITRIRLLSEIGWREMSEFKLTPIQLILINYRSVWKITTLFNFSFYLLISSYRVKQNWKTYFPHYLYIDICIFKEYKKIVYNLQSIFIGNYILEVTRPFCIIKCNQIYDPRNFKLQNRTQRSSIGHRFPIYNDNNLRRVETSARKSRGRV